MTYRLCRIEIGSLSSGAFLLDCSGLLRVKECTTHCWYAKTSPISANLKSASVNLVPIFSYKSLLPECDRRYFLVIFEIVERYAPFLAYGELK